jgi:hypothetical protein
MKRVRLFVLSVAAGALLAFPSNSFGLVTIGSNLSDSPNILIDCLGSCTRVQTSLRPDEQAANGFSSPTNGTVVAWRIRSAASATQQPVAFRVISPAANGQFTGGGSSPTVTPPDIDGVTTFATSIPIKLGDLVGLNYTDNTQYFDISAGPNSGQLFNPVLAQGATRAPQQNTTEELLVNADIEPTSTLTAVKKKAKKKGKVRLTMNVPNPGTLVAGDKKDKGVVAVVAAPKPKLLKKQTVQVTAPGQLSVLLKPTKAAKAALAAGQKPKAKLKLVFRPNGGNPFTRLVQVKLKP